MIFASGKAIQFDYGLDWEDLLEFKNGLSLYVNHDMLEYLKHQNDDLWNN